MVLIIKFYALIHYFIHKHTGYNLRGLGFLYRFLKKDLIISVNNKNLYLNHKISDNYGRLINENFNEPETHMFLDFLLINLDKNDIHFVDIGANIGEFILDYYDRRQVKHITAFEPQNEQIFALKKTIELNSIKNITLHEKCVSGDKNPIYFKSDNRNSTGSGIIEDGQNAITLYPTTIDNEFNPNEVGTFIFLIDTEGAEFQIMKGGSQFIENKKPIIIFEYNFVTRKSFAIGDVITFLGSEYEIFRLRNDGKLDKNFTKTWNLVAIPKKLNMMFLNKIIIQ